MSNVRRHLVVVDVMVTMVAAIVVFEGRMFDAATVMRWRRRHLV